MADPLNPLSPNRDILHYYGDQVRVLLFIAGFIMLISLPFFKDLIPQPINFSIVAIVIVSFLAGLTNPKQVWTIYLDLVASLIGFLVFEYYAITNSGNLLNGFFVINQTLALLLLAAFYFSTKSLRGFYLRGR